MTFAWSGRLPDYVITGNPYVVVWAWRQLGIHQVNSARWYSGEVLSDFNQNWNVWQI
jgi:hypothetical protein